MRARRERAILVANGLSLSRIPLALALWIAPGLFLKLIIIMALLGGVLTIVMGGWHVIRRQKHKLAIPYGVAIAAAGLWVLGTDYLPAAGASAGFG